MMIIAIIQLILHYLGLLAVGGGIIALVVGNIGRGSELVISGLCMLGVKHLIGFIYLTILGRKNRNREAIS